MKQFKWITACLLLLLWACGAQAQGWLTGWSKRVPVLVSNVKGVNDLTGAQVKLSLTATNASDLFTVAASDGSDLRVTDSDGTTLLAYYRQSYNAGTQTATVWFKLATLLAFQSKTCYVYYGKSGAADASVFGTGATGGGTFAWKQPDSGTQAVFHFNEGAGTTATDTASVYTATLSGGATWAGSDGGSFGGVTQSFSTGDQLSLPSASSSYVSIPGLLDTWNPGGAISLWFTPKTLYNSSNGTGSRILQKFNTDNKATTYSGIDCYFNSSGQIEVDKYVNQVNPTSGLYLTSHTASFPANVPVHLVIAWDRQLWSLYANGKLEAQGVDNNAGTPYNGAYAPLRLGTYVYNTPGNFINANYDELLVLNHCPTSEEVNALYNRRVFVPGLLQSGRWQQATKQTLLEPTQQATFDQYLVLEPTLIAPIAGVCTDWQLYFSGNTRATSAIGRAVSKSPTGPFSRVTSGAVITSEASQSHTLYDAANSQYVNFSSTGYSGATTYLVRRTSATGLAGSWSAGTNVLTAGTGATQAWMKVISNVTVHIEGSVWKMILECGSDSTSSPNQYQVGEFESADQGVTWTPYASNPLTSLQLWSDGSASHVDWIKSGGVYYAWYHVSARGFGPSNIAFATSTDLKTWTPWYGGNPVMSIEGDAFIGGFADQRADVRVYDFGSWMGMIADIDRNVSGGGHDARLDMFKYPFPFANLITDLPELAFGSPTTSGSVTLTPGSSTQYTFSVSVTGTNTSWLSPSTFSIPASAATLTQTITDATHATLTITPNGVASPFVVTDTTTGQTFSVSAPTTGGGTTITGRRFIH